MFADTRLAFHTKLTLGNNLPRCGLTLPEKDVSNETRSSRNNTPSSIEEKEAFIVRDRHNSSSSKPPADSNGNSFTSGYSRLHYVIRAWFPVVKR